MWPRPLEDILSTLWIKNILPLVSRIGLSHASNIICQYYAKYSWSLQECKQVLARLRQMKELPLTFDRLLPDPVQKVCLGVSDLQRSTRYWMTLLGMNVMEKNEEKKTVLLGFSETQVSRMWNLLFNLLTCKEYIFWSYIHYFLSLCL